MSYYTEALSLLLKHVKNPHLVLLDKASLRKSPYTAALNNGLKIELRPLHGDRFGFFEVFLRGDYTGHGQQIKEGDTVLDIGANIGCFSLFASRLVGPTGRVIAVEPVESTFQQLQHNIALNGADNITAKRCAISSETGSTRLFVSENSLFSSMFRTVDQRQTSGDTEQVVETTTLQHLADEEGVGRFDYIKMDCEGAEHGILGSLSAELGKRIDQLTIEMHEVPGRDLGNLHRHIERLGLSLRHGTVDQGAGVRYYSRTQSAAA
ncbi:MAG: FkbM family methyltransferase [Pseudomonadota bacterium]